MPARNEPGFTSPGPDPDNHILPADLVNDDALWALLNAYADGEATAEEIVRIEGLLHTQPEVAREFAFLKLTADSVRTFGEVEPPSAMTDAIFAATTRRTGLLKRVSLWWSNASGAFGPAPLRIGAAALASGVLAVVLWSRYNSGEPTMRVPGRQMAGVDMVRPGAGGHQVAVDAHPSVRKPEKSTVPVPHGGPVHVDPPQIAHTDFKFPAGPLSGAALRPDSPLARPARGPLTARMDSRPDKPTRLKSDSGSGAALVARGANVEERHMASDSGADSTGVKPDDLGPDVDSNSEMPIDSSTATTVAANYDEPPTTVSEVSYKPGSISAKTQNAPPAVQSLYMRTQEAIKRQHDLQQYGGYGRDAYNNIQRGEVGLSLVGGRF